MDEPENDQEATTSSNIASTSEDQPDESDRMDFILQNTEKFLDYLKVITEKTHDKGKKNYLKDRSKALRKKRASRFLKKKNVKEATFEGFSESPSYINGEMRDYQIAGLNWMIKLYENGLNGILADEMGLGKTLQTISLLGYLRYHKDIEGKHLIFAPKSTIRNWVNECERWCPEFRCVAFIGDQEERYELKESVIKTREFDILVTNYEMMLNETSSLTKIRWKYLIVDEGHRLKNEKSIFSKTIRHLKSEHRMILTGTPLQNNLHELWALLNFLLPDIFSSAEDFDLWFDTSTVLASGDTLVQRLHAILNPFFLRRIKSEVETSLPPKIEYKLYAPITSLQRDLYIKTLKKEFEIFNPSKSSYYTVSNISQILMNLRKICNHPYMLPGVEQEPFVTDERFVQVCGKMQLLDKLLAMLKQQESRVLIFSQFKGMLTVLEDYLDMRGYIYHRLDGDTNYEERTERMEEFNKGQSDTFVFLLSTRAGGLGINLQAADAVIIYDSDWNPQMDRQAEDRAHRIGQKKQVRVFRLISEKTIEERIVQRAAIKLQLDKKVIQEGRLVEKSNLSKKEIAGMIAQDLNELMDSPLSSITDKSIQEIMKTSQVKAKDLNEKVAASVINFESFDTIFKFDGENYLGKVKDQKIGSSKNLRSKPSDVKYFKEKKSGDPNAIPKRAKKDPPKIPEYPDFYEFQFYKKPLKKLLMKEYLYRLSKRLSHDDVLMLSMKAWNKIQPAQKLTNEEEKTKNSLLKEGFNWNLTEFNQYLRWIKKNGMVKKIFLRIVGSRNLDEVNRYNQVFQNNFYKIKDPAIARTCREIFFESLESNLKEILEVAGGNFLRMAQVDNEYRIGCKFDRKIAAYILEKFYLEGKYNLNLFQEMSERLLKIPVIFSDFKDKKGFDEAAWIPTEDNMVSIIRHVVNIFKYNILSARGIYEESMLGVKEDDENLKLPEDPEENGKCQEAENSKNQEAEKEGNEKIQEAENGKIQEAKEEDNDEKIQEPKKEDEKNQEPKEEEEKEEEDDVEFEQEMKEFLRKKQEQEKKILEDDDFISIESDDEEEEIEIFDEKEDYVANFKRAGIILPPVRQNFKIAAPVPVKKSFGVDEVISILSSSDDENDEVLSISSGDEDDDGDSAGDPLNENEESQMKEINPLDMLSLVLNEKQEDSNETPTVSDAISIDDSDSESEMELVDSPDIPESSNGIDSCAESCDAEIEDEISEISKKIDGKSEKNQENSEKVEEEKIADKFVGKEESSDKNRKENSGKIEENSEKIEENSGKIEEGETAKKPTEIETNLKFSERKSEENPGENEENSQTAEKNSNKLEDDPENAEEIVEDSEILKTDPEFKNNLENLEEIPGKLEIKSLESTNVDEKRREAITGFEESQENSSVCHEIPVRRPSVDKAVIHSDSREDKDNLEARKRRLDSEELLVPAKKICP